MTDSLSRLVLRAQGRLPVAAPLLPSRFAGVAADGGWGEEISESAAAPASSARAFDPPVFQQPATQRAHDAAPPIVSDADISPLTEIAPTQVPPLTPQHPLLAPPQRALHAVAPPTITDPAHLVRPVITAEATADRPRMIAPERLHSPEPMPPAAIQPAPVPTPIEHGIEPPRSVQNNVLSIRSVPEVTAALGRIPPATVPRQADTVPEVRISIGRVEVHAPSAPATPMAAPRQTPARRPTVTLADYLAERGRAR